MPRIYDENWFEKLLHDHPPEHYRLTIAEVIGLLCNSGDICYTLAACYNCGFRRGRNFERNAGKKRQG